MKIFITYFKPSGKYYTEATLESNEVPMFAVVDMIKILHAKNELPGLHPGNWDGPIHLYTDSDKWAVPHLLLPGGFRGN